MSIDKDLLDQLMEGRAPGDLFGQTGILQELTKALAERALSTEMEVHLSEEEAQAVLPGQNEPANRKKRHKPKNGDNG
jgi:putative transposase